MKTIVLTGGGTAGHVFPNLALLPELKKHFGSVHYFGGKGIERTLAMQAGLPYHETTVVKFDRGKILDNFKIPRLLKKGIYEAATLLKFIAPDVVFSKGGYASLPVCLAAKKLGIPVVCHESDYSLGLANKIIAKFAKKVLTSFPETKGGIFVGNPVREEFFDGKDEYVSFPNLSDDKKTILICGGSTGSAAINSAAYQVLPELSKRYNVIHICGKSGDFSVKCNNYYQCAFSDSFPAALKKSDLIICRAGANTLCEAAATGTRCITVPLPKGSSRGDQILNARSFEKRGYCKTILQENLTAEKLLSEIEAIWYKTPPKMNVLQINKNIVKQILSVIE